MASIFDDYDIEEIYKAISFAETGGEKNPWIRTKAIPKDGKGSTAYGPVQITGSLLDDYYNHPSKRSIYDAHSNVADKLREQANLFNYYGNEPETKPLHPKHASLFALPYRAIAGLNDLLGGEGIREAYDYGGRGSRMHSGLQKEYKALAMDLMQDMMKDNANKKEPFKEFLIDWRGEEDEDYMRKVNQYLGR